MNLKLNKKVLFVTSLLSSVVLTAPVLASGYDYSYTYDAGDAAAATGFFGLSLVYICCLCLIPLVIDAVLAYVVYNDAKKNNVENPALWAVVTFFFNVIGLLIYFLAIRPDAMKKNTGVADIVNDVKEKVEEKVDEMKDNSK